MTTEKRKAFGIKDLEKRLGHVTVEELIHTFRMTDELSLDAPLPDNIQRYFDGESD